jgi:hypothetical protein
VPFTDGGGAISGKPWIPQQTTAPVPAWIAQLWPPPAAIEVAAPEMPSTDAGGSVTPEPSYPQQTTAPVPAWIAQLK